jgi:hypothetical protein
MTSEMQRIARVALASARWLAEVVMFLVVALLLLLISLQRDAPTKFIYYNF